MKESLASLCESFLTNSQTLYKLKGFKLTSPTLMPVCAYIYTANGKSIDADRLLESRTLAKGNSGGIFSGLKSVMQAPLACTLAISDDPEDVMNTTVSNLEKLKKTYKESYYLGLAALLLQAIGNADEFETRAAKGKVLYDCLKTRHKINTDSHDTLTVNIAAYSEKPVETIADEVEEIYTELKPLTNGEYAQTCALILSCSDKPAKEKASRMKDLFEALQIDKKNKYSSGAEIVVLSALSLLDADIETLKSDILDVYELLSSDKNYKGLIPLYGKRERWMHSAMMVIADNITPEINTAATAAIYMSSFYLYEIEEANAAAVAAAATV